MPPTVALLPLPCHSLVAATTHRKSPSPPSLNKALLLLVAVALVIPSFMSPPPSPSASVIIATHAATPSSISVTHALCRCPRLPTMPSPSTPLPLPSANPVFFDDYDATDSSNDEGKCFHSSLYSSLLCCLLLLPSSSSIAAAAAPPYHSCRPYLYCRCILCFPSSSSTVATASHCPAASITALFIPLCIVAANRHYNSPGHCCIPPLLPPTPSSA
ncbi:hypothetical protein GW17_00029348 [Ensete ventricosum]|nr:hypothetical protein GW17_00029348 [Ensete ventricosum]